MKKILIIGAGISGLSLAYFLEKKYSNQVEITLIEKEERVGGWIRTFQDGNILFEQGPRAFRSTGKGEKTRELALELGLNIISANNKAKNRYILHEGKLERVGFAYMVKRGGILPILTEAFKKRGEAIDESIGSFFRRRLSQGYLENLLSPLCQGIFAQSPEELSMKACFTPLWESEQKYGSLIKALYKRKKNKNAPPLSSFEGGMEELPKALAKRIKGAILLKEEVKSIEAGSEGVRVHVDKRVIEGDLLVLASGQLFNLAPSFAQNRISLTIVNMAFSENVLSKHGFGFLCKEPTNSLLGITFDSEIFSEHNKGEQTRLCAMLKGSFSEKEAKNIVREGLARYLQIKKEPEKWLLSEARNAIYQYPVGHIEKVKELESTLPKSIILTGARFYGIAVNDCIHRSYELAKVFNLIYSQ